MVLARGMAVVWALVAGAAQAGPCDYRPSRVAGDAAGPVAEAARQVGVYTLTGVTSGGTMLGASGTGASGALSAAGAAATAPATVVVGAMAAAGIAGYEGLCYFSDKRVTRYDDVLDVVRNLAANADPEFFRLDPGAQDARQALLTVRNSSGEMEQYAVADLYIVNGELRYRSKGRDGVIGNVDFVARAATPAASVEPMSALKADPVDPAAEAPAAETEPASVPVPENP